MCPVVVFYLYSRPNPPFKMTKYSLYPTKQMVEDYANLYYIGLTQPKPNQSDQNQTGST